MSYLLGNPAHHCYVYADFHQAISRFSAIGIGPFFVMNEVSVTCTFRGEQHPFKVQVGFAYSGESCIEINAPLGRDGISAFYSEFLDRNPQGGLHHIAYYSDDFEATLERMAGAGMPMRTVVDSRDPLSGQQVEIFCEPVGVNNAIYFQLMRPGMVEKWFAAIREIASQWDGADPIRDARPLLAEIMSG